jgi:hypothetical protein
MIPAPAAHGKSGRAMESFISDTMIQRVFGRFREQLPVLVED